MRNSTCDRGSAKELCLNLMMVMASLMIAWAAHAQPPRNKILADVAVTGSDTCQIAQIGFNLPVRYVNHIPIGGGTELLIKIKPIAVSPQDVLALKTREAYSPAGEATSLREVVYEGDIEDGPFIALHFARPVKFRVKQGLDYRGVSVTFHTPDSSTCEDVKDAH